MSKKQLEMAEQQLLGFAHAKAGYSVVDLADAMGLTKKEWDVLQDIVSLSLSDKNELNEHFSRKK